MKNWLVALGIMGLMAFITKLLLEYAPIILFVIMGVSMLVYIKVFLDEIK